MDREGSWLSIADLNGDGKPDIITQISNLVSIYKNTSTIGSISLATRVDFNIGTGAGAFHAVGVDVDGNGETDLVVACGGTNVVKLFNLSSL